MGEAGASPGSGWLLLTVLCAAGCARLPSYPQSPQWGGHSFQNPDGSRNPPVLAFLRRTLTPEARHHGDPGYVPPQVANDGSLLRDGALQPSVTWIGHATVLIQFRGANVLTDPIFSDRIVLFRRHAPPGVALERLPRTDLVLISHDHRDHLDEDTVLALGDGPRWIVPLGIAPWLRDRGITRATELDWWQSTEVPRTDARGNPLPPIKVTAVPASHWGRRGLTDSNARLWSGYVIEADGYQIYFAGDTGHGDHFRAIAARFPAIDLALLPIGAYEPRWYMRSKHLAPDDAAHAFDELHARWLVPIHWGTFQLSDEPMAEPPRLLRTALGREAGRLYELPIGGILHLPARAR